MALTVKRFPVRARRLKKFQKATRHVFDSFACEVTVITLIFLYAIIIFVDLAYTAAQTTSEETSWDSAMRIIDIVLLSVFMIEIFFRLFGFGLVYLYARLGTPAHPHV